MIEKIKSSPHRALITLLVAVLLAFIHQYLFYGHEIGLSYPLFVILFYSFMYIFAQDRMRALTLFDAWIAGVVLLLSLTYLLFDNFLFQVLNFLIIPVLIMLHLTYVMGRKQRHWWEIGLIGTALDHLLPQTIRHIGTAASIMVRAGARKMHISQKAVVFKISIGLLVSIPILFVVLTLLTSADGVFHEFLSGFPAWLDQLAFMPMLPRIIWIGAADLLFFGYVWGFVQPMQYEAEKRENAHWKSSAPSPSVSQHPDYDESVTDPETKASITPAFTPVTPRTQDQAPSDQEPIRLDPVIAGTILTVINTVYILFVFVQFSYLFGAGQGELPNDLSYAEYARSGFTELILVTGLNFLMLIIALEYTRPMRRTGTIVQRVLLLILISCSGIMLCSAFVRLNLYEQAYGYTYIRFLVHAFMIFLALLLMIAALRLRYTRLPLLRCYIVLGITAYTVINYAGMDTRIAELNIERYHQTGQIDTAYLASLSTDAMPLLVQFADQEYPELKENLMDRKAHLDKFAADLEWPSFNLARYRAQLELSK
ncbi:DUF4173 domain-containing protein [Paenibacillus barcinonensis]|uniref:DUF4153 domain-containing protein n=1 Tax=Paenibacillus barcinonensis TaxID=198119 RepID=UPI001C11B83B|nr:DUF4173 domain-containing protein [Paenibacillus barcinonensis]MBU5351319.1 DUF4173 domain-containing protein [Paenibacillus barcinonensis]